MLAGSDSVWSSTDEDTAFLLPLLILPVLPVLLLLLLLSLLLRCTFELEQSVVKLRRRQWSWWAPPPLQMQPIARCLEVSITCHDWVIEQWCQREGFFSGADLLVRLWHTADNFDAGGWKILCPTVRKRFSIHFSVSLACIGRS
jgi:hypothetical protein